MKKPIVGTIIGDPCGIGPEVVVKAWASGKPHEISQPVLVGSQHAVHQALEITELPLRVRRIESTNDLSNSPDIIDLIDTSALRPDAIRPGQSSAECGAATGAWLHQVNALAEGGHIAASVIGPVDTAAMKAAGVLHLLVPPVAGETYLLLVSGRLRVAHLTDHMPLREVCQVITSDLVTKALVELDASLKRWGLSRPAIGVAGLNPHAVGDEEEHAIKPGIAKAKQLGVHVEGPVSPDAVFRQGIEGRYDAVLAMFHDQGHIAVKTWGFAGNSVVVLGSPQLMVSVAHGTAYDIVGKGIADPSMMQNAMVLAGSLAGGGGFPSI